MESLILSIEFNDHIHDKKMALYNGADVRRINHALKVYGFASCVARREN
ncbi:MAG: hypothetical protein PF541_15895 [Prolixibacteraceae bacterium]|nr:hypothetical protein [Prolixibacteraceae bacterium]